MKEIVTSWTDFERLMRTKAFVYVDKTEYVYRMARDYGGFFFLSRPRRFGKSLMCSTFDALFSGKRDLFEGLWISSTDYDFKTYPVLRFDFSKPGTSDSERFLNGFRRQLHANAKRNAVSIHDADPSEMMDELLSSLVSPVIIIDEFDSAIIDAVSRGKTDLAEDMRVAFNSFYKVIKSHTGNIRFLFITGCTKLSGLSIFSAMNNIRDISMSPEYAGMFGYTEAELLENFSEHIDEKFKASEGKYSDREEFISALRDYYDGYRFSLKSETKVYNPVSIGNYFSDSDTDFNDYWMMTGGSSTLAVTLARHANLITAVEERPVLGKADIASFDVTTLTASRMRHSEVLALLYYAGYLTIAGTRHSDVYLDFPNTEVRCTFLSFLVSRYGWFDKSPSTMANDAYDAAVAGDVSGIVEVLNGLYRSLTPMDMKGRKEQLVQLMFKALFVIAGLPILTEVYAGKGRLDAFLTAEGHSYIFELKVDGESSEDALSQILDRHYDWIAGEDSRDLHLVGIDFRTKEQQIVSYSHQMYGSEAIEHKVLG